MYTRLVCIAILLAATAPTLGSPFLPYRNETGIPPPPPPPPSTNPGFFLPVTTYAYDVATGVVDCRPAGSFGVVSKTPSNMGHDITALVTFKYPPWTAGKTCRLAFDLDLDLDLGLGPDGGSTSSAAAVGGTGKIDVFTSSTAAPECSVAGRGRGNHRDRHVGRMAVGLAGGRAAWEMAFGTFLTAGATGCRPAGTTETLELVGVGDEDWVRWDPLAGGPRILVS